MKGGYKIIDFGGSSLSSTPVTKADILAALKDNYGKVVLLTGVVIGDNAMDDCFSTPLPDGDDGFKLSAYDGYIAVTKVGAVTYTSVSPENLAEDLDELAEAVGDLDDLETTDKDSVVDAINEVNGKVTGLNTRISGNVDSVTDLISKTNSLASNDILAGRASTSFVSTNFGISSAGTLIVAKVNDSTLDTTIIVAVENKICKGRINSTDSSPTWSDRAIFTGTAYTPA